MGRIHEIQSIALEEVKKRFSLNPVSLKYPLPERAKRTLGLIQIDGEVFSSEKFSRMVLMRVTLPFYLSATSTFLLPRAELGLPLFDAETVLMGKKRILMVDIQARGGNPGYDDDALCDRLITIRERYPSLLEKKISQLGEIQSVFSRAACQVKITEAKDEQALSLFREYLAVFLEMVEKATPLDGDALDHANQISEAYLSAVLDHDPGVKTYKMLFGKEGGVARALDIFFAR
jgi:hypothetical protein